MSSKHSLIHKEIRGQIKSFYFSRVKIIHFNEGGRVMKRVLFVWNLIFEAAMVVSVAFAGIELFRGRKLDKASCKQIAAEIKKSNEEESE